MDNPVPVKPCQNCGRVIWRQGSWFQCPDCGCLSTTYGGYYANLGKDGKELGAMPEFRDAVDAVRCHFALRYKETLWLACASDGAFITTSNADERKTFCLFDAKKMLKELGKDWEICDVSEDLNKKVS